MEKRAYALRSAVIRKALCWRKKNVGRCKAASEVNSGCAAASRQRAPPGGSELRLSTKPISMA